MFGQDAISTMKAIFENWEAGTSKTMVVATASGYWDALSMAPWAYSDRIPYSLPMRTATWAPSR